MAAPVEIGVPTPLDLRRLYGLARSSFADTPGWNGARVLAVLERDLVFVAREQAQPAGYVALRHDPASAAIIVDQLLVAPGHEQRGIGRRLLAYAEGCAIAEQAMTLRIVAEESNWRARSFYRRAGFVPVDTETFELVLPHPA